MLILVSLLLPLILLLRGTPIQRRAAYAGWLFIGFALFWYAILGYELSFVSPDGTYGSDARYYWNAMLSVLAGQAEPFAFDAPLYVFWGWLVLATSPTQSVAWVIVCNIVLVGNALMLLFISIHLALSWSRFSWITSSNAFFYLFFLMSCNGIIVWMVIRGLKEPLICFLIALHIFLIEVVFRRGGSLLRFMLSLLLVALFSLLIFWGLNYLRPLGGALILPYLAVALGRYLVSRGITRKVLLALALIPLVLVAMPYLAQRLGYFAIVQERFSGESLQTAPSLLSESAGRASLLTLPFSVTRFVTGPGPIRSVEQLITGDVFEVSTVVGDILIFLGSTQWWLVLIALLGMTAIWPRVFLRPLRPVLGFLTLAIVIVGAYSYVYFGTGDTRHRAFMYFFSNPVIVVLFSRVLGNRTYA